MPRVATRSDALSGPRIDANCGVSETRETEPLENRWTAHEHPALVAVMHHRVGCNAPLRTSIGANAQERLHGLAGAHRGLTESDLGHGRHRSSRRVTVRPARIRCPSSPDWQRNPDVWLDSRHAPNRYLQIYPDWIEARDGHQRGRSLNALACAPCRAMIVPAMGARTSSALTNRRSCAASRFRRSSFPPATTTPTAPGEWTALEFPRRVSPAAGVRQ